MKPPSNPIFHHPAILLLDDSRTHLLAPAAFKQAHAHLIATGLARHTYPLARLLRAAARPPLAAAVGLPYALSLLAGAPPGSSAFLSNTLISALAARGHLPTALALYARLLRPPGPPPNAHTYPSLLAACAQPGPWALPGRALHAHIIKLLVHAQDQFVTASLLSFYSKLGKLLVCRYLFDEIPHPDLAAWNSILAAYARCSSEGDDNGGACIEALLLFVHMQHAQVEPNEITLVALITACGCLGALSQGLWAHAYLLRKCLTVNRYVGTVLIDMYSKCGRLDLAEQVFSLTLNKDTLCYNAMMRGLSIHGHGCEAIKLFDRMRGDGVNADDVTFVVVLSACAHVGLVEEGCRCFDSMEVEFGIEPKIEHYGCLVDLLGRAGQLEEAAAVVQRMPIRPNAVLYRSLLGACRIHNYFEIGEQMLLQLIRSEPEHGGNYVLLSNVYANTNRWEDVQTVRKAMKDRGIDKTPGSSLVEINGAIHEFVVGDKSHPFCDEIYAMVDEVTRRLHECGHRVSTREVLFDVEEEDKEDALSYHSERLAIAFALLASNSSAPIRIIKNLRVCSDCHSSFKLISLIYRREIIVRDRTRFHHFRDGTCSCLDYW